MLVLNTMAGEALLGKGMQEVCMVWLAACGPLFAGRWSSHHQLMADVPAGSHTMTSAST